MDKEVIDIIENSFENIETINSNSDDDEFNEVNTYLMVYGAKFSSGLRNVYNVSPDSKNSSITGLFGLKGLAYVRSEE